MNFIMKTLMNVLHSTSILDKFPIQEKDLDPLAPLYVKHLWIALKELVEESPFIVECNWNPKSDCRVANISVRSGVKENILYKFRLNFPINFPLGAPEVELHNSIPAPLFVAFMKHPIFSNEWSANQKLSLVFSKLFRQLELCHQDLSSDTSILQGDFSYSKLFPVSFGDVSSIYSLSTNIAIECLVTELYGVYISEIQNVYKELEAIETCLYPDEFVPVQSKSSVTTIRSGVNSNVSGAGYSKYSSMMSKAPTPTTHQSKVKTLIEKISFKLTPFTSYQAPGVYSFLRYKAKEASSDTIMSSKLEWILFSPLPELLFLLINECSMEEVYRSLSYISHLYTITVTVEVILRNIWKDGDVLENDATKPLTYISPSAKGTPCIVEESSLLPSRSERRNRVKGILTHMYAKLVAIEQMTKTVEERNRALPWIATVKKYSQIYRPKKSLAVLPTSVDSSISTPSSAAPFASCGSTDATTTASSSSSSFISPPPVPTAPVIKKQKLFYVDGLEKMHYHLKNSQNTVSKSNSSIVKCPKAWMRELMFIEDNIPDDVAIFISEAHPNYIIVLMTLIANRDSPYYGGTYLFHMCIPDSYPNSPPTVHLVTTGEGRVRFNPNLYDSGYVCLSLLGTWAGEPWCPQTSNITQVILSIMFLIFTEEPYYNEPGYLMTVREHPMSMNYNYRIMRDNLLYAIVYHLRKPSSFYGPDIDCYIRTFYEQNWNDGYEIGKTLTERYAAFCKKHKYSYVDLNRTINEMNALFPLKKPSSVNTVSSMDIDEGVEHDETGQCKRTKHD